MSPPAYGAGTFSAAFRPVLSKIHAVLNKPFHDGNLLAMQEVFCRILQNTGPRRSPEFLVPVFSFLRSSTLQQYLVMRRVRLTCLLLVLVSCQQITVAQVIDIPEITQMSVYSNPTGKWESLQWTLDVWVLDLKSSGAMLTGTVSIVPGPGRPPNDQHPADIYEGRIDKNRIEFRVKSPDNMRVIVFSGTVGGSSILLTRKVEMPQGASPGGDDIFGAAGPKTLVAERPRRVSKRSSHIDQ